MTSKDPEVKVDRKDNQDFSAQVAKQFMVTRKRPQRRKKKESRRNETMP